jgi:glycogen debranching enzyme
MAIRVMTIKKFATHTLSAKATVDGFLSMHRQFLNGYSFLEPILEAYDNKELLPTPTLSTIQSALMSHFLEQETKKAQAKMDKADEAEESVSKNYTVSLFVKTFDKQGQLSIQVGQVQTRKWVERESVAIPGTVYLEPYTVIKPAVWQVADFGAAMQLADRKLFQREDSTHIEIVNNFDRPITTHIQRGDAVARFLAPKKQPFSRARGMSTKSLNFGVKVSESRDVWHLKK